MAKIIIIIIKNTQQMAIKKRNKKDARKNLINVYLYLYLYLYLPNLIIYNSLFCWKHKQT